MDKFNDMRKVIEGEDSYIEYNKRSCLEGKPIKRLVNATQEYTAGQGDQTEVVSAMIISFNLYINSFPDSLVNSVRDHLFSSHQLPDSIKKKGEVINKYLETHRENLILSSEALEAINKSLHLLSKNDLIKSAKELVLVLEDTIKKEATS